MATEVKVPDIGDFDAVEIIEILVAPGDSVAAEDPLIVLESDKATMEVPSPVAGTVAELKVAVGGKVAQGDVVLTLDAAAAGAAPPAEDVKPPQAAPAAPAAPAPPAASAPAPATPAAPVSVAAPASGALPHASPSIRLLARELGVDLNRVNGSGPKGRILREDVQNWVKTAINAVSTEAPGSRPTAAPSSGGGLPSLPVVDFSKFGEIERKALPRIRKLSAAHLHRAWVNVPHVTQFESADITELDTFRRDESARGGVKLTMLPFLVKAVAVGLRKFPEFNSSLDPDGEHLILKKYTNIGFAADTENGLVVPVIREADRKSVTDLAIEAGTLAATARDGKLGPAQMSGGCFSISSLGGIGGSFFTPIVNAPEVAILGVSRAERKPVWTGESFEPRLMLPLSLSYDHRVIDGAAAARFVVFLAEMLADPRRLLL